MGEILRINTQGRCQTGYSTRKGQVKTTAHISIPIPLPGLSYLESVWLFCGGPGTTLDAIRQAVEGDRTALAEILRSDRQKRLLRSGRASSNPPPANARATSRARRLGISRSAPSSTTLRR